MFTSLASACTPSTIPSALLVFGNFDATIHVLHVLPEDGTIECFSLFPASTPFHHRGAKERSREQISTVKLHVGSFEAAHNFLADVKTRVSKLQTGKDRRVEVTQLVREILCPAALEAIHEREGQDNSINARQTYPVYLVYIRRSWARRALVEMTSFP